MRAEIEPTWGIALRLWWAWLWRTLLLSVLLGIVSGVVVGVFGHIMAASPEGTKSAGSLVGACCGLVTGIFIFKKKILGYRGRNFRVAILENE